MQKPTQALQSVNSLGYTFDLNPKWERTMPSFDIFSWVIYRAPKSKYQSSVSGQVKEYFGGSKGEHVIAYALLEVTSPEAALTGNDVT
jgi:hypothetical protein